MHYSKKASATLRAFTALALLALPLANAYAVPSFARQTGQSCDSCHTVFPQLTPFGREFKLHGYTLSGNTKGETERNQIDPFPPLSAMLLVSNSSVDKKVPDSTANDALFPDEFSIFYAGRISDSLGTFLQATYDGTEDHFGMDNADIRMVNNKTSGNLVLGLTLNNSPTVQDLWNTTPVWGFPYVGSPSAPGPAAATQLEDALAQQVAGLGAYAFWDRQVYAELTAYRSAQIGGNHPADSSDTNVVDGTAPYWRLAWQHDFSGAQNLEIGTYGIDVDTHPGDGTSLEGATDHFRDWGIDSQYQYLSGPTTLTVHANYIDEKQDWNASYGMGAAANPSDNLHSWKIDATYYHNRKFGGSLGYFSVSGDADPGLYAPGEVDGSRTGKPDSDGMVYELDYVPWLNTKFALQYTAYNKFNGASSNYDGSGRDASDNNTLYLSAWLLF
jgi:hypothetical protein